MQLIVRHRGEPFFSCPYRHVGKALFVLDHGVDFLLESALCDEAVDLNVAMLPDTLGTVGGLCLDCRIPP